MSWQQLIDDGYIIAGTPDTVANQMKELVPAYALATFSVSST
ncbi:MAG: hypothetical protein CM1200mP9_12440 [Gammaproteobacteria bacterium]|nr:MAG: hypothetical protein CM1200mP9_12440 [Gammaproteobacteria bacterium]